LLEVVFSVLYSESRGTDFQLFHTIQPMPFIYKILKQIQNQPVGSNIGIYTVGVAPSSAIVSNIRFYNGTVGPATVTVAIKPTPGSAATNYAKIVCGPSASTVFSTELSLGPQNVVEVNTSGASLDIVAFGAERTP
jgi:hypothetical protein